MLARDTQTFLKHNLDAAKFLVARGSSHDNLWRIINRREVVYLSIVKRDVSDADKIAKILKTRQAAGYQ